MRLVQSPKTLFKIIRAEIAKNISRIISKKKTYWESPSTKQYPGRTSPDTTPSNARIARPTPHGRMRRIAPSVRNTPAAARA